MLCLTCCVSKNITEQYLCLAKPWHCFQLPNDVSRHPLVDQTWSPCDHLASFPCWLSTLELVPALRYRRETNSTEIANKTLRFLLAFPSHLVNRLMQSDAHPVDRMLAIGRWSLWREVSCMPKFSNETSSETLRMTPSRSTGVRQTLFAFSSKVAWESGWKGSERRFRLLGGGLTPELN